MTVTVSIKRVVGQYYTIDGRERKRERESDSTTISKGLSTLVFNATLDMDGSNLHTIYYTHNIVQQANAHHLMVQSTAQKTIQALTTCMLHNGHTQL